MEDQLSIKIFVIDDDESTHDVIEFILKQAGHQVEHAFSVEEAGKKFRPDTHQLVLCDIQLPDGSGIDFLKSLQDKAVEVPVIMITNYASLQRVERALKYGAYAFICKPIRRERLLEVVKYVFEKGRMTWEQIISEENIYSYFPPPS